MQGGNFLHSFHSNIDTTLKFSRHNFSRKKTGTEIAAYSGGGGKEKKHLLKTRIFRRVKLYRTFQILLLVLLSTAFQHLNSPPAYSL